MLCLGCQATSSSGGTGTRRRRARRATRGRAGRRRRAASTTSANTSTLDTQTRRGGQQQRRRRFSMRRQRRDQSNHRDDQLDRHRRRDQEAKHPIGPVIPGAVENHRGHQQHADDRRKQPRRPNGQPRCQCHGQASHGDHRDQRRPAGLARVAIFRVQWIRISIRSIVSIARMRSLGAGDPPHRLYPKRRRPAL